VNEEDLRAKYEQQRPFLQAWGEAVAHEILSRLVKEIGPDRSLDEFLKIPPKPRIKTTRSFLAKAVSAGNRYACPLDEITDKVGVRFVVLLRTEIGIVAQIVERCERWQAEKSRDFDAERCERPHHFDYQSVHYIVRSLRPETMDGVEIPTGTPCEVQIRTLLQHAYAELAHDTTYKPSLAVDHVVRREIAKSAALVEATDDIFVGVKGRIESVHQELRRVHSALMEVYEARVGPVTDRSPRLTYCLLDPYRDHLAEMTPATLAQFLDQHDFVPDRIRQRASLSVLYSDPCVIALYFFVQNHPDLLPERWPVDRTHLEMIYCDLGISTEGRL